MKRRKVCCIITLIMLCLLILNFFLPIASNGDESASFIDAFSDGFEPVTAFIFIGAMTISFSSIVYGIIICIRCLCNTKRDYKYVLAAVPIPMFVYFLLFILLLRFANGEVHMSIGGILGPIICIACLVLVFVGNTGVRNSTPNYYQNNYYANNTPNAQIKGYDPMTGKPIFATFSGYNPKTGEPIYR